MEAINLKVGEKFYIDNPNKVYTFDGVSKLNPLEIKGYNEIETKFFPRYTKVNKINE